jgi:hypothetical protein
VFPTEEAALAFAAEIAPRLTAEAPPVIVDQGMTLQTAFTRLEARRLPASSFGASLLVVTLGPSRRLHTATTATTP